MNNEPKHVIESLNMEHIAFQYELRLLRAQTTPHFIMSALNALKCDLSETDVHVKELINAMVVHLRYAIDTRDMDFVPLEMEFDAARGFLDVLEVRFKGKLEVDCKIDESAKAILVPGIIIQPLIGNAVKYGRQTSPRPVRVRLMVTQPNSEKTRIEVSNTGQWVDESLSKPFGGFGMQNLRRRLEILYSESHSFQVLKDIPGWVTVRVEVPVKR